MKRVILHVGQHKTGTSAVQWHLSLNKERLAQQGIIYPIAGRDTNTHGKKKANHHQLARQLNSNFHRPNELAQIREAWLKETEPYETILMSSEAFQNIHTLKLVRDFFAGYHLTVIAYFREHLDYCRSAYVQRVRANNFWTSFEYFATNWQIDVERFFSLWDDLADVTHWRLFDRAKLEKQNVIDDLVSQLGLDASGFESSDELVQQPSMAGNLLAFKLQLNMFDLHQPAIAQAMNELAGLDTRYNGKFSIGSELAKQVRSGSPHNKALERKFGSLRFIDYSEAPPILDPKHWASDLEIFLDHQACRHLKGQPPFSSTP